MKVFFTIFVLFFSPLLVAEEFVYSCNNSQNGFSTTWMVNSDKISISHLGSMNSDGKNYDGAGNVEIIFWNYPLVGAYIMSNAQIPTFLVFNFERNTYNASGHYDGDRLPYAQLFDCYKSQL